MPNLAIRNLKEFTPNECIKDMAPLVDSENWTNNPPYIGNSANIEDI